MGRPPSTPPLALISSNANTQASTTDRSLVAIVPLSECKPPTLTGVNSQLAPSGVASLPVAFSPGVACSVVLSTGLPADGGSAGLVAVVAAVSCVVAAVLVSSIAGATAECS